ncbi:MAG TPA: Dyp-type peroxidase [Streptosporangiaceae bacterium]
MTSQQPGSSVPAPSRVPPQPQPVASPLTEAAIFLVAVVRDDPGALATVRSLLGDLAGLVRAVGFRSPHGFLTCVAGIGDALWDRLAPGGARPAGLHPFTELAAGGRRAVATPGDLLFHIRAAHTHLCFELASQLMDRLRGSVEIADEVHGFRYFDNRDLLGFADGTENPEGPAADQATIIGAEDQDFAGGSYVIVQKYLHDLDGWNALPVEAQERIIGRTKLSDIELADDVKPSYAHNALTSITGPDGEEVQILRDNMPFGSPGRAEFGTYFIGYARSPEPTEQMLRNMFLGDPPGNYDRILDFSRAVTGTLFFVPSADVLDHLADEPPGEHDASAADASAGTDGPGGPASGSLSIGSLKGACPDE